MKEMLLVLESFYFILPPSSFILLQRGEKGQGFGEGFFVFLRGIAVGDNAAADVEAREPPAQHHRANRHPPIHPPVEREVAGGSHRKTADGFERGDSHD